MFSILLSIAVSAAPLADPSSPQPSSQQGPQALTTPEEARAVCLALTPTDRLSFEGSAVDRSEAERAHEAARGDALQRWYRITVPARQLSFAPYDAENRTLSLWSHFVPAGAEGGARLALVEEEGLPVRASAAVAQRIARAQEEGTLALDVTFALADGEEAPCFTFPGARASTFSAEPVAWQYVSDGEVLARGGQGSERPLVSVEQGARPRVELRRPVAEGFGEVSTNAPDHVRDLESCYSAALRRDPYLDGAIVAALDGAAADRVRIAADTVQDEALAGCVRDVLARVDVRGAGRTWLPIHFVLESPAEAEQQAQ